MDDQYIYVSDLPAVELDQRPSVWPFILAQAVNFAWFTPAALFVMPYGIAGQFDVSLLTGQRIGIISVFVALMMFLTFCADMTYQAREQDEREQPHE